MRNLYDVIDQMRIYLNPESNQSLLMEFESIQNSLRFTAPEMEVSWWNETSGALNRHINTMTDDQITKIGEIFSGNK